MLTNIFDHNTTGDRVATADARESIRRRVLSSSRWIQTPNFARCSDLDLRTIFDQYDNAVFAGSLRESLKASNADPIPIVLSGRLRSAGGRTVRVTERRSQRVKYRIEIASSLLFENFRTPEESVDVVGITCTDRLDALMRVMEHEMLHLAEFLAFGETNCAAKRFQKTAVRLFGHKAHKHSMITRRQRVLSSTSIRPGHRVRFQHDGEELVGTVNRINSRATVLVEHRGGQRYTDGRRYLKFYVPVNSLGVLDESLKSQRTPAR
ncbi:MAG: SprT-like family protein [Burkholderiales bacterium]|nr:SprT-like family protein [Phycisphaerae bacterium]